MISNITPNATQESHFSKTAHLSNMLHAEETQNYLDKDWHPDDPKHAYIKNGHMILDREENQSEAIWTDNTQLPKGAYTFKGHLKATAGGQEIPSDCLHCLLIHIKYKDSTSNKELTKTIEVHPQADGSFIIPFKVNAEITTIGLENKKDTGPAPADNVKLDIDQLILSKK